MPDITPPPVERKRVRRRPIAALASLALVAGLTISVVAPVAAAAAPSPGCSLWDAISPDPHQADLVSIDAPFFEGESITFEIDPVTPAHVILIFIYGTGPIEIGTNAIEIGTNRDPFSFVVPGPIERVAVAGADGHPPELFVLRDLECTPAAVGPGPLVTIDKMVAEPSSPFADTLDVITGTEVTYRLRIANLGDTELTGLTVSDDQIDLVTAGCTLPATLAIGATAECTYTSSAAAGTTVNVAVVDTDQTAAVGASATVEGIAPDHRLGLVKSSPVAVTLPPGIPPRIDADTATEGDTLTFVLTCTFVGDPVPNVSITDVLPAGFSYVPGSASDSPGMFRFDGYDDATRTLSWSWALLTSCAETTYRVTVDADAASLPMPLRNQATIDSDQTVPAAAALALVIVAPGTVPPAPATDTERVIDDGIGLDGTGVWPVIAIIAIVLLLASGLLRRVRRV